MYISYNIKYKVILRSLRRNNYIVTENDRYVWKYDILIHA